MSKRKYFGTDGIRGKVNTSPMDPITVMQAGMAAGHYFTRGKHRHRVVIGKDTRLPGYMVEQALTSGLLAMGMDVFLLGPMPTSGIAVLTRSMRADLGIMISASHNPYHDNGIKFFAPNGMKLSDEVELEIETLMDSDLRAHLKSPELLGRAKRIDDAQGRYIQYVKQSFPKKLNLDGLKVVIDCANGAAYKLAPMILWEMGVEVITMSASPDGYNINEQCGALHPQHMAQRVVEEKADLGIALDGDADRLIISDENGKICDGDHIIAAIANYWKSRNQLKNNGVVTTVMSNLGMENYLTSQDITLVRSQVGDRYVIEEMQKHKYNLGGEPSGHLIFRDHATTGDGLVAAMQVMGMMVQQEKSASEALSLYTPYPQILKNVRYNPDKHSDVLELGAVKAAIKDAEHSLGSTGRILIRKSGTEPLIRVMVECEDAQETESLATKLADEITALVA